VEILRAKKICSLEEAKLFTTYLDPEGLTIHYFGLQCPCGWGHVTWSYCAEHFELGPNGDLARRVVEMLFEAWIDGVGELVMGKEWN
jgi:hypothetical protein